MEQLQFEQMITNNTTCPDCGWDLSQSKGVWITTAPGVRELVRFTHGYDPRYFSIFPHGTHFIGVDNSDENNIMIMCSWSDSRSKQQIVANAKWRDSDPDTLYDIFAV